MTQGVYIPALDHSLLVECSGKKVRRIYFSPDRPDRPSKLAEEIAARLGHREKFPAAELDLSRCSPFQKKLFALIQEIPCGETMTYGEVAALAGKPGAARAVGRIIARNPFAVLVPCHRVVAKNGLGGYAWGLEVKQKLLALEREHL